MLPVATPHWDRLTQLHDETSGMGTTAEGPGPWPVKKSGTDPLNTQFSSIRWQRPLFESFMCHLP